MIAALLGLVSGPFNKLIAYGAALVGVAAAVFGAAKFEQRVGATRIREQERERAADDTAKAAQVRTDVAALGHSEVVETLRREFGTDR